MNLNNLISLSRSFVRAPITPTKTVISNGMQACVLKPLPASANLRVLELTKVPIPSMCAGDVLVRVHASSINPLDNQMRYGYAKSIAGLKIESPLILGRECSGVIEKVGNNVWNFKVGDEIVAATAPFRQAVDESEIALKPKNLSHIQSASLPFNSLTAWNAISIANIQPGMKVLVLGGSGRVGFILVSLLHNHFHCHVTTSSSPSNSPKIISLGLSPDNIIDHSHLSSLSRGYDVVFDVVGTAQSESLCVEKLKEGGTYITFNGNIVKHADNSGIPGIAQAAVESTCKRLKMIKNYSGGVHYGYALFSPSGENLKNLMQLAEKNILVPDVGKTFPLEEIEKAYEWKGSGKVVLTMPACVNPSNVQ